MQASRCGFRDNHQTTLNTMWDIAFVLIALLFFAGSVAYTYACERL